MQSEVYKAENAYNRILEYSNNSEDVNATYWETQLVSYQKSIDLAKSEVHNTILKLSEKGVNVTEIEKQSKATADNIAKIEENLDTLPSIEMDLISQYNDERKLRSKLNKNIDFIKNREHENEFLFQKNIFTENKDSKKRMDKDQIQTTYINTENQVRNSARR